MKKAEVKNLNEIRIFEMPTLDGLPDSNLIRNRYSLFFCLLAFVHKFFLGSSFFQSFYLFVDFLICINRAFFVMLHDRVSSQRFMRNGLRTHGLTDRRTKPLTELRGRI